VVSTTVSHDTHTRPDLAWSSACVADRSGSHRVHVVGYVRGPSPRELDCDRPLFVVCGNGCPASDVMRCGNHRASKCGPCSARYRHRVQRVAAEGLLHHSASGYLYLLTVTAPAADEHLQWTPGWDRKSPRPVCGCDREMADGLGLWNASASMRWNRLRTSLKRLSPDLQYFKAVETQKRGAIHYHLPVWSPVPLNSVVVQGLALRAGFGCVLDLDPIKAGDLRAAAYVSKYVSKATDSRDEVPWEADVLDRETGEVRLMRTEARYRTWSASRGWGMTMRAVREAIRAAAVVRAARLAELADGLSPAVDLGVVVPAASGDPPT